MAGFRWQVTGGRGQVTGGRWQVTGGRWQVSPLCQRLRKTGGLPPHSTTQRLDPSTTRLPITTPLNNSTTQQLNPPPRMGADERQGGEDGQVAGFRWQVTGGRGQVTGGRWQVTGGRWQVSPLCQRLRKTGGLPPHSTTQRLDPSTTRLPITTPLNNSTTQQLNHSTTQLPTPPRKRPPRRAALVNPEKVLNALRFGRGGDSVCPNAPLRSGDGG